MQLKEAGVVWTYPNKCAPLDEVKIVYEWTGLTGQKLNVQLTDAEHRVYLETTVEAGNGKAEFVVKPGGKPGVHRIRISAPVPGKPPYVRHGGFRVCARTAIASDTGEMDELLELLEEGLRQAIDITNVNGKPRTYYEHADNTRQNLAFPAYGIGALRYFMDDVKSMFEAIYDNQWPDGRLPDHIYGDNYPCPYTGRRLRTCMADLETGMASTLCQGWHAHGDDQWLRELLPKVEAGLDYVTSDPLMFDQEHAFIKRPHGLDEWDISFTESGGEQACGHDQSNEDSSFVLMQGDTSGLYFACALLAQAYATLGDRDRSERYRTLKRHYCERGNRLFWDGVKYRHHIHLDPFDHRDFDEDDQLAMSNSWAITRGFADHDKAVSIINEYVRRWKETGDRFPWWSLQPGYPDSLGYLRRGGAWSKGQGEYANGGLFPWVGAELCRGAFQHGMEKLAFKLLRDAHHVLKRDNGAMFTWYHLDGSVAINAPHNQTNYDNWGMAHWAQALIEGLVGITSEGKLLEHVHCAPRWPATDVKKVAATAHFPASDTYFSYHCSLSRDRISLHFTGTGEDVAFRIMLPGWKECSRVTVDGKSVRFRTSVLEGSSYVVLNAEIRGARELVVVR